ncbi:MAG: fumarylacetoacetate hydrolase family protein [Pseudomonadota bacterium]
MDASTIDELGNRLFCALNDRQPISPLTERFPTLRIEDAYAISRAILKRRLATGEKVIGKKVGVTSQAVMDLLKVDQPDFGYLTDAMAYSSGADIPVSSTMIQPKAEGEIAFILSHDLSGPGVTADDVLAATQAVCACFEIVDSRIRDWKITIADTVADNASSGALVLGDDRVSPREVDLVNCEMVIETNGEVSATGTGAAAMGHPANCVAWLANTLGALGTPLLAGEVILSGSLGTMLPATPGDEMTIRIDGIGTASARFV